MKLLIKAMKRFVDGLNNEDFGEIAEGIWVLDDYIRERKDEFTSDKLNEYSRLFDEFLDWENWYYEEYRRRDNARLD